jgi:hypothetical protein
MDTRPTIAFDVEGNPWIVWNGKWDNLDTPFTIFYNRYSSIILRIHSFGSKSTLRIATFTSHKVIFEFLPKGGESGCFSLEIYSLTGRRVKTLKRVTWRRGEWRIPWVMKDEGISSVRSDVYIALFSFDDNWFIKKFVLLK